MSWCRRGCYFFFGNIKNSIFWIRFKWCKSLVRIHRCDSEVVSPTQIKRYIIIRNIIYIFFRVFNFNPQSQRQFKEPYSLDSRSAGSEQWSGFVWSCGAPLSCHWSCGSPGICWENSEKLLEFGSWHGEKSWQSSVGSSKMYHFSVFCLCLAQKRK